jgi:hypothetical protein
LCPGRVAGPCHAPPPPCCGRPSLQYRTLQTGINSNIEYLLEFGKSDAAFLAPHVGSWTVVSSTKEFVRYHTPAVVEGMQVAM